MYDKISKEHRYEVTAENIITDFSNSVSHNNSINQKFIIHNNQIEAIELHTDQYYRPISDFDLDYKLLNENSEVIYSGDIVLGDIGVNDNILIYFNRGLLKMEIKDLEGAYNDFSQSISIYPDFVKAYLARASVSADMNDYASAQKDQYKADEIMERYKKMNKRSRSIPINQN